MGAGIDAPAAELAGAHRLQLGIGCVAVELPGRGGVGDRGAGHHLRHRIGAL